MHVVSFVHLGNTREHQQSMRKNKFSAFWKKEKKSLLKN